MITKLLQPGKTLKFVSKAKIYFMFLAILLFIYGFYLAIFASPPDYLQGEVVRIMYVHVPSAWMALVIYSMMAVSSAIFLKAS